MEPKNTPTPWTLKGVSAWSEPYKDRGNIFSCNLSTGTHVPNDQNYTNAEFIVRAVNAHSELLNQAKNFLDYLRDAEEDGDLIKDIEQAIAKAEGKKAQ